MKIVFFGSDDFAAVHLKALLRSSHQVVGCVTQPDRPQGRGMKMVISPIKAIALEADVLCLQPANFKEQSTLESLKAFDADMFVVVAYGRLLTQSVLDIPKKFSVNVHGSLLPAYRGAAPINWAIINGDYETGVTVQKMVLQLDAGDIIAQSRMPITDTTSSDRLREDMSHVGAQVLVKTLDEIASNTYQCTAQNDQHVTYAPKLSKELSSIDWSQSADTIARKVRGLKPWPGTSTMIAGKTLKIHDVAVEAGLKGKAGEILNITKQGIIIACGQDALLVQSVQPEAGKLMPAYDFAQGHRLVKGASF